jgi:hypothetical protein
VTRMHRVDQSTAQFKKKSVLDGMEHLHNCRHTFLSASLLFTTLTWTEENGQE